MRSIASKGESYVLSVVGLIMTIWAIRELISLWQSASVTNVDGHSAVFVIVGLVGLIGIVLALTPFRIYRHRSVSELERFEMARSVTNRPSR